MVNPWRVSNTIHQRDASNSRWRSCWTPRFELNLKSARSSFVFLLLIAIPVIVLLFETGRIVLAQNLSGSFNPESIKSAIYVDPGNPDLHFELGKVLLLTGNPAQQVTAQAEFKTAIGMNPNSAEYWSGLGAACYSVGDQACTDAAFARAQQLAPSNPQVAWQSAVNDVVSSQQQAAIRDVKTFLRLQPDGLMQAFQLLTRGFDQPEMIWRDLLDGSKDSPAQLKFLEFLAADNHVETADVLWQDFASQKRPVSLTEIAPYVDQLLASGHYGEAASVWSYARSTKSLGFDDALNDSNLVFNAGFERQPLNEGFDWRHAQQPHVDLSFSDPTAKDGRQALKVDFTVPQNSEYDLVYQFVPVSPNKTYELSAFFKTQEITSDSGPRLRAIDPRCLACLDATTHGPTGTSDWHRITTRFTTGPTTDMIRLSLWRPRSRSYPNEITGQLWLDDVSLAAADSAPKQQ